MRSSARARRALAPLRWPSRAHMRSSTRYARNGEVSLAYEVFGEGDRDILVTFGWVGSFQSAWENAEHARWLERLGSLGRVILWDKRGTGLSDMVTPDRLP